MKQLPIESENFKYIEKSFKEWLDILGYASTTVYTPESPRATEGIESELKLVVTVAPLGRLHAY